MEQGVSVSRNSVHCIQHLYRKKPDFKDGGCVKTMISCCGLDLTAHFSDDLIRLFALHGCLPEANQAFSMALEPSQYTWTASISANAKLGQGDMALDLYHKMQVLELKSNKYVYVADLKACTTNVYLNKGRLIHNDIIKAGLQSEVVVASTLLDMYAKCGALQESKKVFANVSNADVVAWGAMIAGYAQHQESLEALGHFEKMQQEGIKPNKITYLGALKACSTINLIYYGRLIHEEAILIGLASDVILGNTLIDMYAKCGMLEEAHKVFDILINKTVVSWSAIIAGYVQHEEGFRALELFKKMLEGSVRPDKIICLTVLRVCTHLEDVILIHGNIRKGGHLSDVIVGTSLIDVYAKCGSIEEAYKVFNALQNKNAVCWSAMVAGFSRHGEFSAALEIFVKMQQEGVKPDKVTLASILNVCGRIESLGKGKNVHGQILRTRLALDARIGTAIVDMYFKCRIPFEARKVFDTLSERDVVLWGAMIVGYAQNGNALSALDYFNKMKCEGIDPDKVTVLGALKACGSLGAIDQGRFIHKLTIETGLISAPVVGNCLIDMYTKCGSLGEAYKVFDNLSDRDVVTWDTIISGYVLEGEGLAALHLFETMQQEGTEPDKVTFLSTLKACSILGAIEQGRLIHEVVNDHGLLPDTMVGTALIDMYAKCGSLEEACNVFNKLSRRDVITWDAIVAGCAYNGNAKIAGHYFEEMLGEGIRPSETTFLYILVAYSCAGDVEKGYQHFISMRELHGITPDIRHYTCMVDLLARAGYSNEAEDLLQAATQQNTVGWMSLLSACRLHGNEEQGKHFFDEVMSFDPYRAAGYVLMANIYAGL